MPDKAKELLSTVSQNRQAPQQENRQALSPCAAANIAAPAAKAAGQLVNVLAEHVFYFFFPALLIGVYAGLKKQPMRKSAEGFFVRIFILFNIAMLMMLYIKFGYLSRRHCMPLALLTALYIPTGLKIIAARLDCLKPKSPKANEAKRPSWFLLLVVVGCLVCLPKLFGPMRTDKKYYLETADWLNQNTGKRDIIAVADIRISFYAERRGVECRDKPAPERARYLVRLYKNDSEIPAEQTGLKEQARFTGEKLKVLVIYKIL